MRLFFRKTLVKSLLVLLFLGFFAASSQNTKAIAQEESLPKTIHKFNYKINYTVLGNGSALVEQTISMTNLFDNLYSPEFQLTIASTRIKNLSASDNYGVLNPQMQVVGRKSTIKIPFTEKMVGKDKTRILKINYSTDDFSNIKGKVLEVGFPGFSNAESFENYTVNLKIPNKFGPASEILPAADQTYHKKDYDIYFFSKSTLVGHQGIQASFGDTQVFNFKLRYSLENKHDQLGLTEIALPADTNYQTVIYDQIKPEPESIKVDDDGNWLAQYTLKPQEKMQIIAAGQAQIKLKPIPERSQQLTPQQFQNYTKSDQFWEIDENTKDLAKKLGSPKAIYDYIVNNYKYDYQKLTTDFERSGAKKAIANPDNSVCMEFTDSFIALTRALDIPAREHNGYAYTQNDTLRPLSLAVDVLHAWPEYYDQKTSQWIQVDPTWGNTTNGLDFFNKFDLDHFTFVTHGMESNYPVTAGSYKTEGIEGKDVDISFGNEFVATKSAQIQVSQLPSGISGLPVNGNLHIINTGNQALYGLVLNLSLEKDGQQIWQEQQIVQSIPPFAKKTFPLNYFQKWYQPGGDFVFKIDTKYSDAEAKFTLKQPIDPYILFEVSGAVIGLLLWLVGFSWYFGLVRKKLEKIKMQQQYKLPIEHLLETPEDMPKAN